MNKRFTDKMSVGMLAVLTVYWSAEVHSQQSFTFSSNAPGLTVRGGGSSGGGGFSSGGERGTVVSVFRYPGVQEEVGITGDQQAKIAAILQRVQAAEIDLVRDMRAAMGQRTEARKGRAVEMGKRYDEANRQLDETNRKILEILTPNQRSQLQRFRDQAKANPQVFQGGGFGGGGGGAGGGGGGEGGVIPGASTRKDYQAGGGPSGVVSVIAQPRVQSQLRLTETQQRQVAETLAQFKQQETAFLGEVRPAMAGPGSDAFKQRQRQTEEFRQREAAIREETVRADQEILRELTVAQQKRVKELCLQAQGAEALFKPEVIRALGITPAQQVKLGNLRQQAVRSAKADPGAGVSAAAADANWVQAWRQQRREAERRMIVEVLTPAQQAKLLDMRGRDFPGLSEAREQSVAGWDSDAGVGPGPR